MRVIDWNEYTHSPLPTPHSLSITVGVFDGVHRGHQALIQHISSSPLPTVVTFKQNPQQILMPDTFSGEIISLEHKLRALAFFGIQLAVLIDFSGDFSTMNGRDFISLLLDCQPVQLIAVGRNFRCGHRLDTGFEEIQTLAEGRGVEVRVAPPLLDGGQPVSSSRIRQALAEGQHAEAERLMGWPQELMNYK